MKSVRPQGQGFSQGSQRSGGQTRSAAIPLTPSRLHLLQVRTSHRTVLAATHCFAILSRSSFAAIFHPPRKTLHDGKSSEKLDLPPKKIIFIDT